MTTAEHGLAAGCGGLAEEALEYFIAAAAVDQAARLTGELWLRAYRQGRIAMPERWFGWLNERGGIEKHPMLAVAAALTAANTGSAGRAERWAGTVDRWQRGLRNGPPIPSPRGGPPRTGP